MAYVFKDLFSGIDIFFLTCVFTSVALFIVGAVKSKFTSRNWFLCGLESGRKFGLAESELRFYLSMGEQK